jgi:tRNA(Ile)-lysidine synthase TilS/MesJ
MRPVRLANTVPANPDDRIVSRPLKDVLKEQIERLQTEKKREYREKNREQISDYQREYYEKNREQISEKKREYYEKNRDKWKKYAESWKAKLAKNEAVLK